MRLVELLARELEEWPEGAKYASQDKDKEIRFDTAHGDFYAKTLADDAGVSFGDGVTVTRQEWAAERAKVEGRTEWDGEGLPPVGTVCGLRMTSGAWITVTPTAYGKKHMLFEDERGMERVEYISKVQVRPVRTQEQIAAQERERALDDIDRIIRTVERLGNKADMAEALYAAGYRKQEKSE